MPDPAAPLFARIGLKIDRAERELHNLYSSLDNDARSPRDPWGRSSRIAFAIHNVYNGMEDVMIDIAKYVDGGMPTGDSSHQDLLDQMAMPIDDARAAVLDAELHEVLVDLKGFRHLVRHRYGIDLDPVKIEGKLALIGPTFDRFKHAVRDLQASLTSTRGHAPR